MAAMVEIPAILEKLRAAAQERDWSLLPDQLAEALTHVEYFAGLEIALKRAYEHLPYFEAHHPEASWARALLVWLASYGAPPADLPMDAGLPHHSPGAANYVSALIEVARSAERKTPYENRLRFLANAISNLIVAELAAAWYSENADVWAFQQEAGDEVDEETGEPVRQVIQASFWLDERTGERDRAIWLEVVDQIEQKLGR